MEETLITCIQYSLSNFLYTNATFIAERLYAQDKTNEQSRQLLATAYLTSGKPNQAFAVLEGSSSERNRYLFSLCAFKLGKFREAERGLLGERVNFSLVEVPNGAAGLYLLGLICKKQNQKERAIKCCLECLKINPFLWSAYEMLTAMGADVDPAEFFGSEVPVNLPQVAENFTHIQPIKEFIIPEKFEEITKIKLEPTSLHSMKSPQVLNGPEVDGMEMVMTKVSLQEKSSLKTVLSTPQIAKRIVKRIYDNTSSPFGEDIDDADFRLRVNPTFGMNISKKFHDKSHPSPFVASKTKIPLMEPSTPMFEIETSNVNTRVQPVMGQPPRMKKGQGPSRLPTTTPSIKKAGKLFQNIDLSTTPQLSVASTTKMPTLAQPKTVMQEVQKTQTKPGKTLPSKPSERPKSETLELTKKTPQMDVAEIPIKIKEETQVKPKSFLEASEIDSTGTENPEEDQNREILLDGTVKVLTLFRTIGNAIRLLSNYLCQEAIDAFQKLSSDQYRTGWVLCNVGKAYFEMVQYAKARKVFEEVRLIEPYRTSYMELYSTILWHLKEEIQLSYLAQQLTEFDRHSPATWCAVGNCFSLQKEHETALKFLKRAVQVDPDFTYAYTLSGHEYISSENWDKAMTCFRNAIRLDPRHYNAWYGLGMIFYSQEKYSQAEYHFRKALEINQRSSVLYCYIGMVLNEAKKSKEALAMLSRAIEIDPKNTLAQFKKASVLVSLGDYEAALKELAVLKDKAPKEAPIYFLMGKIYKKQNQLHKAINAFTTALDFDTKSANYIKTAIAKLGNPDAESDEEELGDLK